MIVVSGYGHPKKNIRKKWSKSQFLVLGISKLSNEPSCVRFKKVNQKKWIKKGKRFVVDKKRTQKAVSNAVF